MSSSSLVTGAAPLGCIGSPQPGHRTTGKVSEASLPILPPGIKAARVNSCFVAFCSRHAPIRSLIASPVAQMPRLAKIESCPLKRPFSYLILAVPLCGRPPAPARRTPRRIAKRRIDKAARRDDGRPFHAILRYACDRSSPTWYLAKSLSEAPRTPGNIISSVLFPMDYVV